MYRDEETLEAVQYYVKLPDDLGERDAIVLDPMLATGNSSVAAIEHVKKAGARSVTLVCLVAAPEGIEQRARRVPRRPHRLRRARPWPERARLHRPGPRRRGRPAVRHEVEVRLPKRTVAASNRDRLACPCVARRPRRHPAALPLAHHVGRAHGQPRGRLGLRHRPRDHDPADARRRRDGPPPRRGRRPGRAASPPDPDPAARRPRDVLRDHRPVARLPRPHPRRARDPARRRGRDGCRCDRRLPRPASGGRSSAARSSPPSIPPIFGVWIDHFTFPFLGVYDLPGVGRRAADRGSGSSP